MSTTIRAAGPGDWASIERLMDTLGRAHVERDPKRYLAVEACRGVYRDLVTGAGAGDDRPLLWLVAEVGGRVVGYLLAEHVEIDVLVWSPEHVVVHDIIIDASARGSGAGRALMDGAIAWARARGVRQVRLYTDRDNAAARGAFTAMNFRHTMSEMTLDLDADAGRA